MKTSWVYPIWGVDVGRMGDDASTLVKRQGNTLIAAPKLWRNMDGQQVAGRIIAEYEQALQTMMPQCNVLGDSTNGVRAKRAEILSHDPSQHYAEPEGKRGPLAVE